MSADEEAVQAADSNEERVEKRGSNRERIRQIDTEMSIKIRELHKLMNEGGLTESANLLKQCLPSTETSGGRSSQVESIAKATGSAGESNVPATHNVNSNANVNNFHREAILKPCGDRSLGTIYESAVPRVNPNRNSSSSEEEFANVSGDFDKPENVINAFIAEVRENNETAEPTTRTVVIQCVMIDIITLKVAYLLVSQTRYPDGDPQPSTSDGRGRGQVMQPVMLTSEEKADKIICMKQRPQKLVYSQLLVRMIVMLINNLNSNCIINCMLLVC